MRKTLFKWHSVAALTAMLPLLIVSVTGSILVFKVEIDTWLRPHHMLVASDSPSPRMSMDMMMARVLSDNPGYELAGWEIFDDALPERRTDTAYLMKHNTHDWYKVYINQYTGNALSSPAGMSEYLTDCLLDLHYKFLLHTNGMFIGALVSLLLLFLGVSGVVLYRRFWVSLFQLRWQRAKRILFLDMHKFIGIISAPVIMVLAFTGAYWNILEVAHEVSEHVMQDPYMLNAPLYSPDVSVQGMLQSSRGDIAGFTPTYMLVPFEPDFNFMIFGDVPHAGVLSSEYSSVVSYDKNTGALLSAVDISQADIGHVIEDSFRKLHFGYFAGLSSKIVWSVLGLSPVWLALTGLYMYLSRTRRV